MEYFYCFLVIIFQFKKGKEIEMGKSEILELLIYGLRISSIITMILGAVAMFFLKVFFSLFHLILGVELLILSYSF